MVWAALASSSRLPVKFVHCRRFRVALWWLQALFSEDPGLLGSSWSEHRGRPTTTLRYTGCSGSRPGPVLDPRPQERVLQHTVEHGDAVCFFVQILGAPVPQLGEQLVHFFRSLDTQLPVEQVTDVPKISDDSIQPRLVDRDLRFPQMVEQLAEVPTIFSFASLQQQTV